MICLRPGDDISKHPDFPAWLAAHGGWWEDASAVDIDGDAVTITHARTDANGRYFVENGEIARKVHTIPLQRPVPEFLAWRIAQEAA